jgi:hypothetical protein
MANERTFSKENQAKLLGQALSASYTQVFSQALADNERIMWILIGHASVDVAFDVTVASDSAGTGAADILTAAVTCDTAGGMWTFEIDAAQLPAAKQYLSPKVTLTAGTYTLIEVKRAMRHKGNFTYDSTWTARTEQLG